MHTSHTDAGLTVDALLLLWIGAASAVAFLLFGFDKVQARRGGARVPEIALLALGAIGGWPGGFLGMLAFRHKTAKLSFQVKYGAALVVFAALAWLTGRLP